MPSTITKSLSADFGGSVSIGKLKSEIDADGTVSPANCLNITRHGDDVDITFNTTLSGAQSTQLDVLISTHTTGTPPKITLNTSGDYNSTTTITSTQTGNRTITLPDADDELVGKDVTQTLRNKKLNSNNTEIVDNADETKKISFDPSSSSGSTLTTIKTNQTGNRTLTLPDATDTLVGLTVSQNISNKNLIDSSVNFVDQVDNTKQLNISLGGASTSSIATIVSNHSGNRTLTLPDANTNLVGHNNTETLYNKTLNAPIISTISNTGTLTLPTSTDTLVGKATTDTLTNKTISASSNTITLDTDDVTEGTNLYYTDARFDTRLGTKSTTNLSEGTNLYYTDARADARITTQKGANNGLATLDGGGKVPASQLNLDNVDYQGTWNASTNTPTLANGVGTKGHYYVVSVDGSTNIDGITDWVSSDWIIFNGTVWEKSDHTDQVTSVAGKQGAVSLVSADIGDLTTSTVSEGTNLYYTDARFDTRLATKDTDDVAEGTNLYYTDARFDTRLGTKSTTNLSEGTNLYYTEARVTANTNVANNTTHSGLTNNPHSVTKAQVGLTNVVDTKVKLDATTAPISTNDTNEGYSVGSRWIDVTNDKEYVCVDSTASSAVWTETTGVVSVAGKQGAVSLDTDDVTEGTNLYYTDARFDTRLGTKSTTNLSEGTNLYYTDARFDTRLGAKSTTNLSEGTNLYYTDARFDTRLGAKSTTNLSEGTNLYYTEARVDANTNVASNTTHSGLTNNPHSVTKAQVGLTNVVDTKVKLDATTAPIATNDTNEGYSVGSRWIDVTNDKEYVCLDSTATSAVWTETTGVVSVAGKQGAVSLDTDDVTEGGNLYYTDARFDTRLGTKSTTDVSEGTNLYYTDARFDTRLGTKSTTNLSEGTNLYYTEARVSANTDVASNTTHSGLTNNPHSVTKAQVGLTNVQDTKVKLDATTSPIATNDVNEGYSVGSRWIDVTNDKEYVCLDSTATSAVWTETTGVVSVAGKQGAVSLDTDDVTEGGNLYYTDARFDTRLGTKSTTDVSEGTNLYYTDARFDTRLGTKSTTDVSEGTNLYYTEARVTANTSVASNTTHSGLTNNPHSVTKAQVGLTNVVDTKVKLDATTAPIATNDTNEGYSVGSRWIDVTNDKEYVCLDSTATSAVWTETTGVVSVAGKQGAVSLDTDDVTEGTNLYYTDARFDTRLGTKSTTNLSEGTNLYYTDARADARITTQKGANNGLATLDGGGKVPASQLNLDNVDYQGTWNASTNTPTLANGVGTKGYYYVVSVDGATNIDGITDWKSSDWIIFNGTVWEKSDHTDQVTSVAGKQGAVSLDTDDVAEGTNLYYTDARFDTRLTTKSTTNLNEGTNLYYTDARFDTRLGAKSTTNLSEGTNLYYTDARFDTRLGAKSTTNLSEGTNLYYTEARVSANTDVASNTTHSGLTNNPHSVTKAQVGLTNVVDTKVKLDATTAPIATNDSGEGYSVGSRWIDVTNDKEYVCVDSTATSAVWRRTDINSHTDLANIGSNTHAQIDTHISASIAHGVSGNIVGDTDAQTLTNKTLTTPVISTITNTGTITLPTSTDTLVGRATTDTLTNKTLTAPVISTITNTGTITLPTSTDTLVGRATTDTLTNKTISAGSNTISGLANTDVGLGNVNNTKVKLDATTAPVATNDSGEGYSVGSRWIDVTNDKEYVCVDSTATSAVWTETTAGGGETIIAVIRDEKTNATNGGTINSGAWQLRDLNTIYGNHGADVSLASNQFTLTAGKWKIIAHIPGYKCSDHQARLTNVTDTTYYYGLSAYSENSKPTLSNSVINQYVDIPSSKTFQIEHRCSLGQLNDGFGKACGFGNTEVYTTIQLTKLS